MKSKELGLVRDNVTQTGCFQHYFIDSSTQTLTQKGTATVVMFVALGAIGTLLTIISFLALKNQLPRSLSLFGPIRSIGFNGSLGLGMTSGVLFLSGIVFALVAHQKFDKRVKEIFPKLHPGQAIYLDGRLYLRKFSFDFLAHLAEDITICPEGLEESIKKGYQVLSCEQLDKQQPFDLTKQQYTAHPEYDLHCIGEVLKKNECFDVWKNQRPHRIQRAVDDSEATFLISYEEVCRRQQQVFNEIKKQKMELSKCLKPNEAVYFDRGEHFIICLLSDSNIPNCLDLSCEEKPSSEFTIVEAVNILKRIPFPA